MEENTQTNDVNTQADTTTAGDSSSVATQTSDAGTQDTSTTTQDNGQQASDTLADGTSKDKNVPFARLEQEIAKRAQLEERLRLMETQQRNPNTTQQQQQQLAPEMQQAREQLKSLMKDLAPELGFVSKQEIEAKENFNKVDTTHASLETKYSGKDGLPKYDRDAVHDYALKQGFTRPEHLELAYKQMHEAQIMEARIAKAIQQTRGVNSEKSNGTGSANTGVSNDDLKKAAAEGDQNATHLLIKRALFKK